MTIPERTHLPRFAALLLLASAGLHAQSFAPIPALSFTKTFGGADPLPQILTATSTGANLSMTASASTSNGGNWLSFSGVGCSGGCGTTPQVITVSVNAALTLNSGTYMGQILLSSGRTSLTIPVSLTVVPVGSGVLDNLPGQLSFSLKTAGNSPPSQTIQVRNAVPGALAWSVTTTTADGGAWLVPSAPSGISPSVVTVAMVKSNLPNGGNLAGTFTGQLLFQSPTGSVTIPVSAVVGDNVFQQINPLSFTKIFGGPNPLPQILTIASTGSNLSYTATAASGNGGSWLSISGIGCNGGCGITPQTGFVSINADVALPTGIYTSHIVISNGNQAITVPVTLKVAARTDAVFDNMPGQLTFSLRRLAVSASGQFVDVRNVGSGAINWTLTPTTSDGGNWLSVSTPSGSTPSGPIAVNISVANLPYNGQIAGTFTGQLLFQSGVNEITIPVSVFVGDNVFQEVTPILFTKTYAGADPLYQTLTVATAGASAGITVAAYSANGGSWLSVSGVGCNGGCGTTPQTVRVAVNADPQLPAGTYTGQIVVSSGSQSVTVPVDLVVSPIGQPSLDNLPGQLSFFLKTGTGDPPSQSVQIRNAASGLISWTAAANTSDGGSWLSLSASSGIAPSQVNVSVSSAGLPSSGLVAGTFTGMITVRSGGTGYSIPVSVVVGGSVFTQASPLSFAKAVGGTNPSPKTVTIASTGSNFGFSAAADTANGGNWLSISGVGCNGGCGTTPNVVSAVVNADPTLAAGVYTGQIVATTSTMAMTVPVTLNVGNVPTGQTSLLFVPVTPCRVADTRLAAGAFGGPAIAGMAARTFAIPNSACNIPSGAQAYALNVAVVPQGPLGFLTVWPTGISQPFVATLNSDGRIKSAAAIVAAGTNGAVSVFATNTTDVVIDISGYFVSSTAPSALAYYPVAPCRIADTRNPAAPLGGPALIGLSRRTFPILSSSCGLPGTAQAYSLNFAAVPHGPLGFLTAWPTGQTQPFVASLNAITGTVTANAAIVPAGTNGAIDIYATNTTDLVIDIDGYFAPPSANGLSFYPLSPCRVMDSRLPAGAAPFTGSIDISVSGSGCNAPATAQAYVVNATVVPASPLGFLTLWPQGATRPFVASLNALDAAVTNNLAIVPATNGAISAFATNSTHLVMDIFGYFAP